MPKNLLNSRDMSRRVGVSVETLLGWARRGWVPRIKPVNCRQGYLFDPEAVLEALRARGRQEVACVP